MKKPAQRAATPASIPKPGHNKGPKLSAAETKPPAPPPEPLPQTIINGLPVAAEIMQHFFAIAKLKPLLVEQMAAAEKGGAIPLARAFVAYHRMMERSKDLLKPMTELFDEYKELKVPAILEQAGVTNVPLEEGFRVGASYRFVASIIKDKRDEAYAWLRKHKLGDLIAETVNAGTLSAAAKVLREEKNIELPAEFFTTADLPNTSVTKTK